MTSIPIPIKRRSDSEQQRQEDSGNRRTETPGTTTNDAAGRDAIHLAVEPMIVRTSFGLANMSARTAKGKGVSDAPVGIVDPFLKNAKSEGGERLAGRLPETDHMGGEAASPQGRSLETALINVRTISLLPANIHEIVPSRRDPRAYRGLEAISPTGLGGILDSSRTRNRRGREVAGRRTPTGRIPRSRRTPTPPRASQGGHPTRKDREAQIQRELMEKAEPEAKRQADELAAKILSWTRTRRKPRG